MGESKVMIVLERSELEALVESAVRKAVGASPQAAALPCEWLDAQAAADLIQCHPKTLARWAKRGELPSSRAGRELRFRRSDIDSYLQRTGGEHASAMAKAARA